MQEWQAFSADPDFAVQAALGLFGFMFFVLNVARTWLRVLEKRHKVHVEELAAAR
jgi:hypothetical protein